MTEQEYINVTNLTRVRDALAVLRGIVPDEVVAIEKMQEIVESLYAIEGALEASTEIDKTGD